MFCPNCGLTQEIFQQFGKFGCRYCPEIFLPFVSQKVIRSKTRALAWDVPLGPPHSKGVLRKPSYRYRLSRSFRQGFFPFFDRQESQTRHWVSQKEPFLKGGKWVFPAEDHLRWEWVWEGSFRNLPSHALPRENHQNQRSPFLDRKIWAWKPFLGFLNSCPTNVGRGDRFSVQFWAHPEEKDFWERFPEFCQTVGWRPDGQTKGVFRLQFSWKNLVPYQKRQIQKILSLLSLD